MGYSELNSDILDKCKKEQSKKLKENPKIVLYGMLQVDQKLLNFFRERFGFIPEINLKLIEINHKMYGEIIFNKYELIRVVDNVYPVIRKRFLGLF